jgi:putative ABC transport system substrate-binding protein
LSAQAISVASASLTIGFFDSIDPQLTSRTSAHCDAALPCDQDRELISFAYLSFDEVIGMRRRDFITLVSGAAAWPLAARAQQPAAPVIGWLSIVTPEASPALPFFHRGLADLGYIEGRNLEIIYRWAEFHPERFPALAADLVQSHVSLIAAVSGVPAVLAAKAASATMPIVFVVPTDPVQLGLVASLNRPGGNLTGVAALNAPVLMKQIELMHELLARNGPIAVLVEPNVEATDLENSVEVAAQNLGRRTIVIHAANDAEFEPAMVTAKRAQVAGLVVTAQPLFVSRHQQLAAVIARYAIPTVYAPAELATSGGLMSYGASVFDIFRRAGNYAGKILAGAKPADLPVELPTKFELKINLKTAKALGLTIPPSMLARADEVIE